MDQNEQEGQEHADPEALSLADAAEKSKLSHGMFSNRIFIQPDGMHLRMTFGERIGLDSLFHSSIVVPNSDALEFGQLITKMAQAALDAHFEFMKKTVAEREGEESGE